MKKEDNSVLEGETQNKGGVISEPYYLHKKLITRDNFAGTESMKKVAIERGHDCISSDNDSQHNVDVVADILDYDPGSADYAHFSPPCTGFSVASIGTHWTGGKGAYIPKTDTVKLGIKLLDRTIELIKKNNYKYWTIENPRGVMRKVIDKIFEKHGVTDYKRVTIWYCQYGDERAKPTDIWTNIHDWEGRQCKNENPDCNHIRAPRGAKTGTQGLKGTKERSVIPPALFHEIFKVIEDENRIRCK